MMERRTFFGEALTLIGASFTGLCAIFKWKSEPKVTLDPNSEESKVNEVRLTMTVWKDGKLQSVHHKLDPNDPELFSKAHASLTLGLHECGVGQYAHKALRDFSHEVLKGKV